MQTQNPDAVVIVATSAQDTVRILEALEAAALTGKKYFFTDGSKDVTSSTRASPRA